MFLTMKHSINAFLEPVGLGTSKKGKNLWYSVLVPFATQTCHNSHKNCDIRMKLDATYNFEVLKTIVSGSILKNLLILSIFP